MPPILFMVDIQTCYERLATEIVYLSVQDYKLAADAHNRSKCDTIMRWLDTDGRLLISNKAMDSIISYLKRYSKHG